MALSPEQKRLNRILFDDEYGPKLVHLSKAGERQVLDLIEQNRGREARKLIDKLDEERRADRRIRDKVRRYIHSTPIERSENRPEDESRRFWQLYDHGMVS